MDKLLPFLFLLSITLIGFISTISELSSIRNRIQFTIDYREQFIDFINELFSNHSFNHPLYCELTTKVKEMQYELGADGLLAYVQDNLRGYRTSNYQLLINYLPETRNVLNDSYNSLMVERYMQEAAQCDDMFLRHIGSLKSEEQKRLKARFNPFTNFAEGIRIIVSLPILVLKWFGFISKETTLKIMKTIIVKSASIIITTISFLGSIMSIIVGWNEFLDIIISFFTK